MKYEPTIGEPTSTVEEPTIGEPTSTVEEPTIGEPSSLLPCWSNWRRHSANHVTFMQRNHYLIN